MGRNTEHHPWLPFDDRDDAGTRLGRKLHRFARRPDVVVLGLARGGVPVAAAAAGALELPLGALSVRKLGVPGSPEVAFGAMAFYGSHTVTVHQGRIMDHLRHSGYTLAELDAVAAAEETELLRRAELFSTVPELQVAGRTVLLCDDGMATGATMSAAVGVMREAGAGVVLVCVPAAPAQSCHDLALLADEVVCLQPWPGMHAVSEAYLRFEQLEDEQVLTLLDSRSSHDR